MKKGFYTVLFIALIAAFCNYIYLNYSKWHKKIQPVNISGTVFPKAQNIPAFSLKDSNSNNFDDTQLLSKWSILFFGFTRCPDICPTTLTTLNKMSLKLDELPKKKRPQVIFISIDSEHDAADTADKYAKNFNKHFIGLAGSKTQIESLSKALGVVAKKITIGRNNADYIFDHSSTLYIINPKGQVQAIFTAPHDADVLAKDYRSILNKYS